MNQIWTPHLRLIKVRQSRRQPFSLIKIVIDIEEPSLVFHPDSCPQALQKMAVSNHPIVESPDSSESPTPITSSSTSPHTPSPMPLNNAQPAQKDDVRELTIFNSEEEDQMLESSPKPFELPVPLAAAPDALHCPTRLSPLGEEKSLARTNDLVESVVSDSEAGYLLSVAGHIMASSLSPDKEVLRPPTPTPTAVPSPGFEYEEEGPSFCFEESLPLDPTHSPAGTKQGVSFSLSRSVSPIVAKDDEEVPIPPGVSSPSVLCSMSPLSSRHQIISPIVSPSGFTLPGAGIQHIQADAFFRSKSSRSASLTPFVSESVSRATPPPQAIQSPSQTTYQLALQLPLPSAPPQANKSPTIRIPPSISGPLVIPRGPITIASPPISRVSSPAKVDASPTCISSRGSSPLSEPPSERDQDADSDAQIIIPAKRKRKRETGGKPEGDGSRKRVLNVKVGAPSAATTRVKKRKVIPTEKAMERPLKRAREKVEREGSSGSSSKSKMKIVQKGKDSKTPSASASPVKKSPAKDKGSKKSLVMLGCKWPAVPKKGDLAFKKQV